MIHSRKRKPARLDRTLSQTRKFIKSCSLTKRVAYKLMLAPFPQYIPLNKPQTFTSSFTQPTHSAPWRQKAYWAHVAVQTDYTAGLDALGDYSRMDPLPLNLLTVRHTTFNSVLSPWRRNKPPARTLQVCFHLRLASMLSGIHQGFFLKSISIDLKDIPTQFFVRYTPAVLTFSAALHVVGKPVCLVLFRRAAHEAWVYMSTISRFWLRPPYNEISPISQGRPIGWVKG